MLASESLWGLSLNETLIVVAVILMVIDCFLPTDIPTHLAYVIFSFVIARFFHVHFLYRILIGIVAWFATLAFHYLFWKSVLHSIANKFIAPDRCRTGVEGLIGATGEVKTIEDKNMVVIHGDLWPYTSPETVEAGDAVEVKGVNNGVLEVLRVERSEA